MDGTLVDNLELIVRSFNYAVGGFVGREFSRQEVFSRFGPTLEKMVEDTVPAEHSGSAVARYHEHYHNFFHKYARVYPGITELITGLKQVDIASKCLHWIRSENDTDDTGRIRLAEDVLCRCYG